jgi:hypothetical protein
VIAHVKLDLIDDSMIGKIDEKDFRRRIPEHELGVSRRTHESVLHPTGRNLVVNADTNAHRMDLCRVMQINDRLLNDFVVGDVEIDAVVSAQTGGTPVDLHDFGEAFINL